MKVFAFLFVAGLAISPAQAMQNKPVKLGDYTSSGVITGGMSGNGFSLLRATHLKGAGRVEKFAVVFGDRQGQVVRTSPGYFHIQVDDKNQRVSIDLAEMQMTTVGPEQLKRLFDDSKLVAGTEMTMDPIDDATNISLKLREPVEARAKIEDQNGAKILMIEMRPAGSRN